jgi:hypothetical protein
MLNAARAKTNKPPIPEHVVIRIGEVFDKNEGACIRVWIAAPAPSPGTYPAASAWPAAQRTQADLCQCGTAAHQEWPRPLNRVRWMVDALARLKGVRSFVIDGELVACNNAGLPDF